jgi:basic membrane protein A
MLLSACGSTTTSNPSGGGSTPTTKGSVTVALVTDVGGLNDSGFNQMAYQGYTKAQKQYGFKSVVIQTTNPTPSQYIQELRQAAQSADMVVAVGFLMQNPLDIVAKQFPNKKFAIVDGCATKDANNTDCDPLSNVASLYFKEQEAGCLVGAVGGQMELDGKAKVPKLLGKSTIGAVGGLPIPPVTRYIAGYKYCATKVDPKVNVVVSYSNDFTDPAKCKTAALSQITDKQADIIFQVAGGCGIGVLDAATQQNVYSIGVDSDQGKDSSGKARPSVITSAQKRVDVAVYDIINDAETGQYASFVAKPVTFDLTHDGVTFATPSSAVPADAVTTANNYENQIKSGALVPPAAIP